MDAGIIDLDAVKPAEPASGSTARRAWIMLLLVLATTLSIMDRHIMSVLVEPVRAEFGLTDTQVGILTGFAFTITFAVATIPFARLADRWSRKNVIALAVMGWSLMTALSGLAVNFATLFLARIGVGIGEAGGGPPIQALIADIIPRRQRATAMSIYMIAPSLGIFCGLALGGWAAGIYGWRGALILAALPGLVLGPVIFLTIREVPKGLADGTAPPTEIPGLVETLKTVMRIRTLPLMIVAVALQSLLALGLVNWIPAFIARSHGLSMAEIGAKLGVALSAGSLVGHILGGPLADLLGRFDIRWHLRMGSVAVLASAVCLWLALVSPPHLLFPLIAAQVFLSALLGAPLATVQTSLPPAWARATTVGCVMIIQQAIGLGLGPVAVGALSDALRPALGDESLRVALQLSTVLALPAALFFYLASRRYGADYERSLVNDAG